MIPRDQILDALTWLRQAYPNLVGHELDDEGIAAWLVDCYAVRFRMKGMSHLDAISKVREEILKVVNPPKVSWFPSEEEIRNWRGDFLGRWNTRPMFMFCGMNEAEKLDCIHWYKHKGYTHVPIGLHNDYPGFPQWHWNYWENPELWAESAKMLLENHLIPILVTHPIKSYGKHIQELWHVWPAIREYVPAIQWGWEINDLGPEWANGGAQLDYIINLATFGRPLYAHFTPERWSGWPGFDGKDQDKSEYKWLSLAKGYGLTGILYQDSPDKDEDEVFYRAYELPSPHGYEPGICGRVNAMGLDFVLFEFARDESRHDRIASRIHRGNGFC